VTDPNNPLLPFPCSYRFVDCFITNSLLKLKSNYDRPTVSRPVNLGVRPPSGTRWPIISPGNWVHFPRLLRLAVLLWRYSIPPPHGSLTSVEVEVNLQPTVSQPVCLGVVLPSGTLEQIFVFCLTIADFLLWGALPDERTDQLFTRTLASGPCQSSHCRVQLTVPLITSRQGSNRKYRSIAVVSSCCRKICLYEHPLFSNSYRILRICGHCLATGMPQYISNIVLIN
jgi:hypothetical protein